MDIEKVKEMFPKVQDFRSGAYFDERGVRGIGSENEFKFAPNGQAVCNTDIAVGSKENARYPVNWYTIETWAETAEKINQMDVKGAHFVVTGQFVTRKWVSSSKKTYYDHLIFADFIAVREKGKKWVLLQQEKSTPDEDSGEPDEDDPEKEAEE